MATKKKNSKRETKAAVGPFTFNLTKNELGALLTFASTDETRLHLFGIGLSSGYVAACDGHRLLFKRVTGATGDRVVCGQLARDVLKLLRKPKDEAVFTVEEDGSTSAQVYHYSIKSLSRLSACTYPPIKQVIPKAGEVEASVRKMCVATKYAIDVERAVRKLGFEEMTIRFGSDKISPIVYTFGSGREQHKWGAVLMPRRGNDSGDWVLSS